MSAWLAKFVLRFSAYITGIFLSTILAFVLSSAVLASHGLSTLVATALSRVGIETAQLALERKNTKLTAKNKNLTQTTRNLVGSTEELLRTSKAFKAQSLKLQKGNAKLLAETRSLKARGAKNLDLVRRTRGKVIKRATNSAARNLAAMPMESVPIVGVATVVTVTALELHDLCAIIEMVDDLSLAVGVAPDNPTEVDTACNAWRDGLDATTRKLASAETKMRDSARDAKDVIGGTIYTACTSLGVCQEVGVTKPAPVVPVTPKSSFYDEMVNTASKYMDIVAKYYK